MLGSTRIKTQCIRSFGLRTQEGVAPQFAPGAALVAIMSVAAPEAVAVAVAVLRQLCRRGGDPR